MKVLSFVKEYDKKGRNSLAKIIKRRYAPYIEKRAIAELMINASIADNEGVQMIDSPLAHLNHSLAIVSLYTNLEIDAKEYLQMYDELKRRGIIEAIKVEIGGDDIAEFDTIWNLIIDDKKAIFKDSIRNLLRQFGRFEDIANKVQEALDDVNNEDEIDSDASRISVVK